MSSSSSSLSASKSYRCRQLQRDARLIDRDSRASVERVGVFDIEQIVGAEIDLQAIGRLVAGEGIDERVVPGHRIALRLAIVLHLATDSQLVLEEAQAELRGDLGG